MRRPDAAPAPDPAAPGTVTAPAGAVQAPGTVDPSSPSWARRHRGRILGVAAGLTLAAAGTAAGIMIGEAGDDEDQQDRVAIPAAVSNVSKIACEDITVSNVAFRTFKPGRFLPPFEASGVHNANDAATYTKGLFERPLGGQVEPASLAMIDAAVAEPATQRSSTNNSYSYKAQFDLDMTRLTNPATATQTAEEICEKVYNVLGVTTGFDATAIGVGEQYTTLTAVNGSNAINDLELDQHTASRTIGGVTFKLYNPNNDDNQANLRGFSEVVVEPDGTVDVLGRLPIGGNTTGTRGKGGKEPSPQKAQSGTGTNANTQSGGGSNGGGVSEGNQPERNPNGPNSGNGNGKKPEAKPGDDNTPNSGTTPTKPKPVIPTTPKPPAAPQPPAAPPPPPPPAVVPPPPVAPPPPPPPAEVPKGEPEPCRPIPGIVVCP